MAKKNAIKLEDTNLQMITDINISDVYYKNSFYGQSLFYLGQAQAIADKFWPDDQRIRNIIYYNKAENFFRTNNADSLKFYNEKLKTSKANTYKLYTYKKRTDYYLSLLHSDYKKAINLIHAMQNDEGLKTDDEELRNLSDAYYKNGQPDSAELIIHALLSSPSQANHPENKYHFYQVLGDIAGQRGDYKSAADYFKLSLQQSAINMNRLTQVGNISSLIKTDEVEEHYLQKSKTYSRERIWLIIIILLALVTIFVVTMFYRTVKQKRHYENLLFQTKKEELAFINSHDVRKYLTNILGLIEVIKLSEKPEEQYLQVEDWLYSSSQQLDEAIKNISQKLSD
jgi:tetratricopeptide (TPR) repeat protein